MYLRTGPGPGEAGKKHFYYVDIYFCNTHGARLLHESGSKPSALQPGHNKNITVHSTQHTQHGTQIAELSFPALSHRHRPAVSTRPTPRALSTQPHTKTQARATRPDTGAYAQKGRAGIWSTIFFGVETGPACGGAGSSWIFGSGPRRRVEKMGRPGFRVEGSLTVRKALVFTLGNQIFGQGGDPPEPPLRVRTFLF